MGPASERVSPLEPIRADARVVGERTLMASLCVKKPSEWGRADSCRARGDTRLMVCQTLDYHPTYMVDEYDLIAHFVTYPRSDYSFWVSSATRWLTLPWTWAVSRTIWWRTASFPSGRLPKRCSV